MKVEWGERMKWRMMIYPEDKHYNVGEQCQQKQILQEKLTIKHQCNVKWDKMMTRTVTGNDDKTL